MSTNLKGSTPPKIFISYSHDSPEHEQKVLEFSETLRADGINTRIDQYSPWPTEGWPRWMERHLQESDFVLMVCTETYHRRVTGKEEPGIGKGVCWEANFIYNDLYAKKQFTQKYIPILFKGGKEQYVPSVLSGHNVHQVDSKRGYEDLYRRITNQPKAEPGPIGRVRKLPGLESMSGDKESNFSQPDPQKVEVRRFFISYAHGDADEENLARFLHTNLTSAGHESFIDIGIMAGANWVVEIRKKIEWSDCLILLLSANSMESEMVHSEVRLATLNQGQTGRPRIIPVRIGSLRSLEYELDLYIGHLQSLKWKKEENSQSLLKQIIEAALAEDLTMQTTVKERLSSGREPQRIGKRSRPKSSQDLRSASVPGGTIRYDDPHYIQRSVDNVVAKLASERGQTLVIKGPRQMGKSSVLLHYLAKCQKEGKKVIFVDFQIFSNEDFATYNTFLSRLAWLFLHRLQIESDLPEIESQAEMVQFLSKSILASTSEPIVIAFDEVDRIFTQSYRADFFSMLRLWHNNRSPLTPEFDKLDIALVISTEPYLLINEADRSPFNVGLTIEIKPFTKENYLDLNKLFPDLLSPSEVEELWNLLQGHPYLTRLAYYRLVAPDKFTFSELIEKAADERGPFGDHLRALLVKLHEMPELLKAMKEIIQSGKDPGIDIYFRLYGAGLVRQDGERVNPANLLYARYFRKAL